jgi:hypothetical protein
MDNFSIDVVSEGRKSLELALSIAVKRHSGVTHFAVIDHLAEVNEFMKKDSKTRKTLVLFWALDGSFKPTPSAFPCPMTGVPLNEFVWNWLEHAWKSLYHGSQPDHDGDNGDGWRVFNEDWGHVADSHYGVVGIQPVWAMYGK